MFKALLNFVAEVFSALFLPGRPFPVARQTQRRSFSADVLRADDLLVLRLDFYNLRLQTGPSGKQVAPDGVGDSFIVVHFPPQHVAERAFKENGSSDPLLPPPVSARLAGQTRLVFYLNPALLPLDFSLEKILSALSQSAPLVSDRITQPPGTPPVGWPAQFGGDRSQFSAIEAPWRLILSPHPDGRWAHSPQSVTDGAKTELWHTRLGVRPASGPGVDEKSVTNRTARAVFSPDQMASGHPSEIDHSPFRNSLRRYDRHNIVRATAERTLAGNAPVAVERLMLTSLGSWLQVHGEWDLEGINLVEWRHRATMGRDQFVKVVEKGFLFPLGHRAVQIRITERKLAMGTSQGDLEGKPVAYLRQQLFVVVREPVKRFAHRAFPFRVIEFKTLRTPNLVDPTLAESIQLVESPPPPPPDPPSTITAFWPRYEEEGGATKDVWFLLEGTDWDGKIISFAAPQLFVPASADPGADIAKLVAAYNGGPSPFPLLPDSHERRNLQTGGQKIAFAPSIKPGDTSLETDILILAALNATGQPHFLPAMRGARVDIPAVRQISGQSGLSLIRFDDGYLRAPSSEFGNAGEVFARIDAPTGVKFPVEKTGGLVAPDLTPQGISRNFGPAGDVTKFASGKFDPGAIFSGIKILGGLPLDKIFKLIPFNWPSQAAETVPGLTTVRIGDVIQTRYAWKASRDQLQGQPIFEPQPGAKFELESVIDTPLDGTPPRFHVKGVLEKFEIVLPPGADALIGARFDNVSFGAGTNEKVDVSVKFDDIVFKGPLTFINEIRKYIPLDGFVDPPYIDVNAEGISAGFTLGIPTIGVGIFVLQDISLSAGFHLPFLGGAAGLRFAFCERDHPFLLTVSALGGGGFFGLDLDTEKVTNVEASLEFGAAVAINLGVASGKASITAGVYYQKSGAGFQITAFFRAAGSLSVLGLITVSIELYVGLSFQSDKAKPHGGKLYGTASVRVKIKIVFFSISVSVSIEREFAGSDPTFSAMLTSGDWGEYCNAFAPEL
ncbi:MAG: hypothetical protein AABO41_06770 [Acidobacteriota bacterium]